MVTTGAVINVELGLDPLRGNDDRDDLSRQVVRVSAHLVGKGSLGSHLSVGRALRRVAGVDERAGRGGPA